MCRIFFILFLYFIQFGFLHVLRMPAGVFPIRMLWFPHTDIELG